MVIPHYGRGVEVLGGQVAISAWVTKTDPLNTGPSYSADTRDLPTCSLKGGSALKTLKEKVDVGKIIRFPKGTWQRKPTTV